MSLPTIPKKFIGEEWMNDEAARAEFERGLEELDNELKPVTDALDKSERLNEDDWAICINARD